MLGGSVAFDSSRKVCSTKKSFIKDALSASSVWTMSSLQSGGIDVVLLGLIKRLSVSTNHVVQCQCFLVLLPICELQIVSLYGFQLW